MRLPKRNKDGTTPLPSHEYSYRRWLWSAYAKYLQHSNAPILVGPFRGEIGFEVLYWIPFVEAFAHRYNIDPKRLIPITRGGAGVWYGLPRAIELFGMRTPQQMRVQLRLEVMRTGVAKQQSWNAFDRELVRDAAETLGLKRYHVLHPAWMYHVLAPFWTGMNGIEWISSKLRFRTLTSECPPLPLPDNFIALRFYSRRTFHHGSKLIVPFIKGVLEQLVGRIDIVILGTPDLYLDDHIDLIPPASHPRLHFLKDMVKLTPENNLLVQSAVLQRSQGFVGTYGGFAQLALRMGKPSVSFYDEWLGTAYPHKHLADVLSLKCGVPALVQRIGELPLLQSCCPLVEMGPPPQSGLQTPPDASIVATRGEQVLSLA